MAKNFKSNKAYKSWLAYGHASGEFAKTPGNQKVSIKGKPKKVKHAHGGPHGNPPKKRIKVGGTSIAIPNINPNLSYAAIPAAWVGGLVQGMANKKNKFEENPKEIIKQNPRKVTASYRYGGPPYETETTEEVNEDAMDGMMKARIAYEVMHGNPAAKRLIAPTDEPIITEVEELDDEGYTRTYTNEGTHFMGRKDNVVVPYIQGSPGNLQLDLSYGKDSKEAMKFDSAEDAKYFANENYKRVSPAFQKTYGGPKYPSGPYYPYKGSTLRVNKGYDKNHVQPSVFPNGGKLVTIGDKTYDTSSKEYRKLVESGKVKPYTTDTESGIGAFDYGNLPDLEITAPTQEAVDMAKRAFNRSKQGQAKQQGIQNFLNNNKYRYPESSATKGIVESMVEGVIDNPNNLSYYPGAGELYDAGHLGHSLRQGNYEDAAYDAAGFVIPFAGGAAVKKFAKPIIEAAKPYYKQLKNTVLPISDEISPGLFHTKTAQYGPYSKWYKAKAHAGEPNAIHTTDIISKQNLEGSVSDALSDRLSSLTGRPKRLDEAGIPYSTDPMEAKNMMYMNKVTAPTGSPYYTVPSAFMDSPIDAGRGFNSLMGKLKKGDVVTMDPSNSLSLDSYKSFLSRGKGNKFDLTTDAKNLIPLNQYSKKWQGFNLKKGNVTPEEFYKPSGDAFTLGQANFWRDKVQSMVNKSKIKPGGITDVSTLNRYDFSGNIADKNKFDIYMPIPRLVKRKYGGNITNKLLKNSNTINMANSKRKYNRGGLIAPVPQFPHGGEFHAATPLTTEQIKAKEAAYLQFSKANPGVSFEDWANSVSANSSQALSSWDPRTSNQGYQGIMSNDIVPLNLNAPSAGPIGNTNILDTPPNANLKNRGGFETRNVAPTFNMGGYMKYANGAELETDPPFTKEQFQTAMGGSDMSLGVKPLRRSEQYQFYTGKPYKGDRTSFDRGMTALATTGIGAGIGAAKTAYNYKNKYIPKYQQEYDSYITDKTAMWPDYEMSFDEYLDFYESGRNEPGAFQKEKIRDLGISALMGSIPGLFASRAVNRGLDKIRMNKNKKHREALENAKKLGEPTDEQILEFRNQQKHGGYMQYANGGQFDTGGQMGEFSSVPVTEFNNGGSHEANPLGGIPQGSNALVEEGELKLDLPNGEQFIVSPKIMYKKNDKEVEAIAQELGIDKREFKKFAGKDMVSVFKSLTRKNSFNAEKREGDTIQENSIEADIMPFVELHTFLTERKNAQEEAEKEQAFAQDMDMMMQEHPEYMQAMMAQQQQQQGPSPEEQAMMEQQMMQQQGGAPQEMPPMMGTYGGMLEYKNGGLWANIHAKRDRIKAGSGEKMRKPGSKGAPTAQALKNSQNAMGGYLYKNGGYNNTGFKALPNYVQAKIKENSLATYGGKINPDGSVVHFNNGGYSYSDYMNPQQAMPVQGIAASGYGHGGMMPRQYNVGGTMRQIGEGAYGLLQGAVGSVTGGALDPLFEAGRAGLQDATMKNMTEEQKEELKRKGEVSSSIGNIGGSMLINPAGGLNQVDEVSDILTNSGPSDDPNNSTRKGLDNAAKIVGAAGQVAGIVAGNQNKKVDSNLGAMDAFAAANDAPMGTTTGYSGGVFTGANDMSNYSSYAPGFTAGADGMAVPVSAGGGNANGGYMKYMNGGVMKYEDGGPVLYPNDPEHFMNSYENYKKWSKETGLDAPSEADFKEERTLHMNQYMSEAQRQAIYDKYPELSVDEDIDLSPQIELAPNSESYISETGMNLYDPTYRNYREQLAQALKDKQNKGNKSDPAIYPNDPTNPYNSFDNYKKFIKKLNPNDPAPTRAEFEEERKNNMDQYMTQAQRDAIYNQYPNIAPSTGANTPNYVMALDPQGSAVPNFTPFFNNQQQQQAVTPITNNQQSSSISTAANTNPYTATAATAGAAGNPAELARIEELIAQGVSMPKAINIINQERKNNEEDTKETVDYNYESPDLNLGESGNAGTTVKESAMPYALAGASALYNTLSPRLRKTLQGKDYISPYKTESEVDYDLSEERKQFKRDAAGILKSARNVAGGNAGAYLANLGNYQNQLAQRTAQSFAKENMLETQANAAINARNTAGMNRQNQIQNTMDYQQALAKQQAIAAGDTAALEGLAAPFAARQQEKAGINLVNAYLGPNSPFSMQYQTIGEQFKNRKNTARYGGHLTKKKK